jgi:hypothetical protein
MRVDTPMAAFPDCPHLAAAADRSFEIAWDYNGLGGYVAYGRHYDPSGEPTEPAQIPIGPSGSFYNYNVVDFVTALPNGFQVYITNFDAIFESPPVDFRQRLDLTGAAAGPPETLTIPGQALVGPGGSLYATFYQARAESLWIQAVTVHGVPQGPRILLSSRPIRQPFPQLASQNGSDFVVVWSGLSMEKRARQVLRARWVHQGMPIGKDFDVNSVPGGPAGSPPFLGSPVVAATVSGDFAVTWTVTDGAGNSSIHLRFFDAKGRARTAETVAVPNAAKVALVAVALDDSGKLLLLWRPPLQDYLRARLFSPATGAPIGAAFQLGPNPFQPGCGDAAWTGDSWVITWLSSGDDGKGEILWRRFTG